MNIKTLKQIAIAVLIIFTYYVLGYIKVLPFYLLNIDLDTIPTFVKSIYAVSFDVLFIITIYKIYETELKKQLLDFKNKNKEYLKEYLKYWFWALGLMMSANAFILLLTDKTPANEDAIMDLLKSRPIYIFVLAVFIGPIVEELIFRFSLRKIFKNNYIYIALSGLIFGAAHILGAPDLKSEIMFLIPYSIPGFLFAYTYVKSDNIFVPIGIHFLHNGILMSLQFFILIFLS